MAFDPKPNTGALFKNDKKETDNHPDYKGSAVIDGVDYWMDSWINVSKSDGRTKYMSVKFKPKDQQHARATPSNATTAAPDQDDVPF